MAVVHVTTDVPEVDELLRRRAEQGLDTYDEWHEGERWVVTGPSPEHGQVLLDLALILVPLARTRRLLTSAPANIGVDKVDCRVPDLAVFEPHTPRTSAAFLATARLVVEVLSPGEVAGAKFGFYAAQGVEEYLEVDLAAGTVLLLARQDANWVPIDSSAVLGFDVSDHTVVGAGPILDVRSL